jgi:hypothetical protein|nr:MAG TPA: hypothetical protein [Caudoviricetes sp.]
MNKITINKLSGNRYQVKFIDDYSNIILYQGLVDKSELMKLRSLIDLAIIDSRDCINIPHIDTETY